jgi:hypothetical protein
MNSHHVREEQANPIVKLIRRKEVKEERGGEDLRTVS